MEAEDKGLRLVISLTKGHNVCPYCGHNIKKNEKAYQHFAKHGNLFKKKPEKKTGKGISGCCELCGRFTESLHGHHLIPRKYGGSEIIPFCRDCSRMIHALITMNEMRRIFHTKEMILSLPSVREYIGWVQTKPVGIVKHPSMLVDKKVMREIKKNEAT